MNIFEMELIYMWTGSKMFQYCCSEGHRDYRVDTQSFGKWQTRKVGTFCGTKVL